MLILLGDCSGGERGGGGGAGRQVWVAGQRGARRRARAHPRPRRGQGDVGRGVAQSRGPQHDRDFRTLLNINVTFADESGAREEGRGGGRGQEKFQEVRAEAAAC